MGTGVAGAGRGTVMVLVEPMFEVGGFLDFNAVVAWWFEMESFRSRQCFSYQLGLQEVLGVVESI